MTHRVFDDAAGAAVHALGNGAADPLPSFAEIGGLVDVSVVVALLLEIEGDVRSAGFEVGGLQVPDPAPLRKIGNAFGDVRPSLAAIAGDIHLAVVAAGPDHARLYR